MRNEPRSYQSIAATIPDPLEYVEDENGELVSCDEDGCDDSAVGQYGDQWLCAGDYKRAYAWDHADVSNDERRNDGS